MAYMLITGLLVIFILGILFGKGLAQAAGKEMPGPYVRHLPETYHTQPPKGVPGPVDAEAIRQSIQDADDNEGWG